MIETAIDLQALVEHVFTGMPKRRMTHVMCQRECFDEVFVEPQRTGNRAGDRRNLQRVREPRAMVVAHVAREDLGLLAQAAKCGAMYDPIPIALIRTSVRMSRLRNADARPNPHYASRKVHNSTCSRSTVVSDGAVMALGFYLWRTNWFAHVSQRASQHLPKRIERLRNDPHAGQHRHEIVIAGPPWHQMPVQMSRQSGPRHAPQIQADIEAFGIQPLAINNREFRQQLHALHVFLASQILQIANVAQRRNQQVPVVVRVAIEHHDRRCAAGHHHQLPVGRRIRVVFGCSAAEKTFVICSSAATRAAPAALLAVRHPSHIPAAKVPKADLGSQVLAPNARMRIRK